MKNKKTSEEILKPITDATRAMAEDNDSSEINWRKLTEEEIQALNEEGQRLRRENPGKLIWSMEIMTDLLEGTFGELERDQDPMEVIEFHLKGHPKREEILSKLRKNRPELFR